jgi:hypothetical protein
VAAIVGTYGLVKRLHLCLRCTLTGTPDTISNADLKTTSGLAALSEVSTYSPLYTFLNTSYASAAAAETAFRALGGEVTARQISGTATTVIAVYWDVGGGGSVPFLGFVGGADQVLEVVLSVPHSAVQ